MIPADSMKSRVSCGCDAPERRKEKLRKDLTGMSFGRLRVVAMKWSERPARAECVCECGNTVTVIAAQLTSGKTQSCGCLQAERASASNTKSWENIISSHGVELIRQEKLNPAGQWIWRCRCGLCGKEFSALPAKIMNGHVTSCGCRRNSSREELIRHELIKAGVVFKEQFSFQDCKDKQVLFLDFAVFSGDRVDCLIEYDGKQHYVPIPLFGGEPAFESAKRRDSIKDLYCKTNNIPLIRLPYSLSDEEIRDKVRDIVIRRDCNTSISNNGGSAVLP